MLPQLSPVVIDRIDQADGVVVIAAHPRARGSRCRGAGERRRGCTAAIGVTWQIFPSRVAWSRCG